MQEQAKEQMNICFHRFACSQERTATVHCSTQRNAIKFIPAVGSVNLMPQKVKCLSWPLSSLVDSTSP